MLQSAECEVYWSNKLISTQFCGDAGPLLQSGMPSSTRPDISALLLQFPSSVQVSETA